MLAIIGKIGAAGGTGHVIEFTGSVIRDLSIEGRLTIANMSIEGGARAGSSRRTRRPSHISRAARWRPRYADWDKAVEWWRTLPTDPGAVYDKVDMLDAADIAPNLTWGTSPEDGRGADHRRGAPIPTASPTRRSAKRRASRWTIWV